MLRLTRLRFAYGVIALCLTSAPLFLLHAQDADSAGQMPADENAAPAAGEETPRKRPPSDLAKEPETPAELFDATLLMLDLARMDLAKIYLDEFIKAAADDATLLEIRQQHGPAPFVRLSNLVDLRPASVQLLDRVNALVRQQITDPARLGELLARIAQGGTTRAEALEDLRSTGAPAVPLILKTLQDPSHESQRSTLIRLLVSMGDPAVAPLIAALDSTDETIRMYAMTVLGALRAPQALPYLWYPAAASDVTPPERVAAVNALSRILNLPPELAQQRASSSGAASRLAKDAEELFSRAKPLVEPGIKTLTLWVWDAQASTVVSRTVTAEQAADLAALRLIGQSMSLNPSSKELQQLYLAILFARDVVRTNALGQLPSGPGTATDLARAVGPVRLNDALSVALQARRTDVARAVLGVLELTGGPTELQPQGNRPAPIVRALDDPEERIQFAAARTVLQIDPPHTFQGASRVVEILVRALVADGQRKAVVIHPSAERGTLLSGQMGELGFDALLFNTGKEGFKAASERNDVAVVVVQGQSIRWSVSETIANLKADSRTAGLPILLVGPADIRPALNQLAAKYRGITVAAESQTAADLELQTRQFFTGLRAGALSDAERANQRAEALQWLAHLASTRRTNLFPIERASDAVVALSGDPEMGLDALLVLSELGTPASQSALATVALNESLTPAHRESAALKLSFHIQRFGLLLSTEQVTQLEQQWNATTDPLLRSALGTVASSLRPDDNLVGERIKAFRKQPAP